MDTTTPRNQYIKDVSPAVRNMLHARSKILWEAIGNAADNPHMTDDMIVERILRYLENTFQGGVDYGRDTATK